MTQEREITVEGTAYRVTVSDEKEALLAAKAAGRVFVGVVGAGGGQDKPDGIGWAEYAVESPEAADDAYLERIVRRHLGLPWIIARGRGLLIREFIPADAEKIPWEPEDGGGGQIFRTPEKLEAYIRCQYGIFEYGVWAVVREADGALIGRAGLTGGIDPDSGEGGGLELGYHIFGSYRRRGYGLEACRMILDYAAQEYGCPVYAVTEEGNTPSRRLLEKLGFSLQTRIHRSEGQYPERYREQHPQQHPQQRCSGSAVPPCLCVYCWR